MNMRRKKCALVLCLGIGLFVLIFAIMGYVLYRAAIQPKEGVVIRKDYSPAYTVTDYEYVHRNGESIRVPMQKYHGERYTITIKGINTKGKEDTGSYDITPDEYNTIEIGDYYIKEKR